MTQSFDEWFIKQLGDRDETQPPFKIAKMWASGAYKAGAQSKQAKIENSYKIGYQEGFGSRQAEIDELRKRIDEVLDYVGTDFDDYYTGIMIESIHEILKGTTNEQ